MTLYWYNVINKKTNTQDLILTLTSVFRLTMYHCMKIQILSLTTKIMCCLSDRHPKTPYSRSSHNYHLPLVYFDTKISPSLWFNLSVQNPLLTHFTKPSGAQKYHWRLSKTKCKTWHLIIHSHSPLVSLN